MDVKWGFLMANSIIIILNGDMKNTGNMMYGMHGHIAWTLSDNGFLLPFVQNIFFMLLFLLDQQALISCLVLIYTYVKD